MVKKDYLEHLQQVRLDDAVLKKNLSVESLMENG